MEQKQRQAEKFKEAARGPGADEDDKRWNERIRQLAKHRAPLEGERLKKLVKAKPHHPPNQS